MTGLPGVALRLDEPGSAIRRQSLTSLDPPEHVYIVTLMTPCAMQLSLSSLSVYDIVYIYTYTLAAKIFSSKKSLACLILSFFYFSLKFTIRTFNIHLYVNLYIFFCSKYVRYYNFLRDATSFENLLMKIHDFPQFRFDLIIYRIIR